MNYDDFLSLGIQLIPVLWVVLAVETRFLSVKANERGTNLRLTGTAMLIAYSFPIAAAAMLISLFAILVESEALKRFALILMIPSLVVSILVAVLSLLRTIYDRVPMRSSDH